MYYGNLDNDKLLRTYHKFYSGDGTIEIKKNINTGNVEFITYIGGDGYSAPVVYKDDGITQEYLYLHRDLQGSIIAISNQSGNIVEKRHFDAWGNISKVQDGAGNNLAGLTVLDRGYTGHEHLQGVKLIHMNGRLYDPLLHRFLQPDNFVQDPHNTQNYNRYGYVLNNPLKYIDPSGEEGLTAVAIGVGVAVAAYMLHAISVEAPITFQGVLKTTMIAVWSAGATMGISGGFTAICGFDSSAIGFWNGALMGSSTGFVTGVFSATVSVAFNGGSLKLRELLKGGLISAGVGGALGGIIGGIKAVKSDSNFWSGESDAVGAGLTIYDEFIYDENIDFKLIATLKGKFPHLEQKSTIDCGLACVKANNKYFNITDNENIFFRKVEDPDQSFWASRMIEKKGLWAREVKLILSEHRYFVNNNVEKNFSSLISEINKNRPVFVLFRIESHTQTDYHWSIITGVEQEVKTGAFRMILMNPSPNIPIHTVKNFESVHTLFSVFR